MKLLITLLFILAANGASGQCEKLGIERRDDEMRGETTFNSPYKPNRVFMVLRTIAKSPAKDELSIAISMDGYGPDYSASGIFIKFDDGAVLKDEKSKIDCSYDGYGKGYRFTGVYTISADEIDAFLTKKIVKVQVDDFSEELKDKEGLKIQQYIKCIQSQNL